MRKKKELVLHVCHLYPDLLNLYGDRGNVLAFIKRCQWRNIEVCLHRVELGQSVDFKQFDFLFIGGGSDREQHILARDLASRVAALAAALEEGLVTLAICGGYQLLGQYYQTARGEKIPGLGILDVYTVAGKERMIGNVVLESLIEGVPGQLVGFENHAGRTYLGDGVQPLGRVLAGRGNNGQDGYEGAVWRNVFCSYLHGPLLPKNFRLTDHLITLALDRRGFKASLPPLDNTLEEAAVQVMVQRLLKK
ncbi:MAG: type 1 glutamine amidotransferase [Desulfurispora sp.]|uniref:type 1 glutamine amidotransferase n=1 Tax=Desulfurispora sp. TaxID=3014275 RepID=UPI00404B55A8